MKGYVEDGKGNWYAVLGDGNIVMTNNKEMQFEFTVIQWYNSDGIFVGRIKKV